MIARIWHGATPADQADAYFDYLNSTGIPDCQRQPGNRGVYVLRRLENGLAHFLMLTFWDSELSLQRFTGTEPHRARYYPLEKNYLVELEPSATHYEVLA